VLGERLSLSGGAGSAGVAEMRSWGPDRNVRAAVVRDIVRGRLAPDPDPHGLRLRGARIVGRLDLANVTSSVPIELMDCLIEDGLDAVSAHLAHLILLGCRINGAGEDGAVQLLGARIGGQLGCRGTKLSNESGRALEADGLQVEQDVFLDGGFEAVGGVRLLGARIGGQLGCRGAKLSNESGPALEADGLQVEGGVFLVGGFEAVGAGEDGAVRLLGARIGELDCSGAKVSNESGPALDAEGAQVERSVFMRHGFEAVGASEHGVVLDLTSVQVGGVIQLAPARWEHRQYPRRRMAVDGLTYTGLPTTDGAAARGWLALLGEATPGYAAQPYQQLAAAHRAAGHDGAARRVLIQQRRDQLDRGAVTDPAERAWARLTGITLGYGYQPWRALIFLLAVVLASVVLAVGLGGHAGALATKPDTAGASLAAAAVSAPCSAVLQIGVGLDLGLPLVKTGARDRCQPTNTRAGDTLTITSWALQVLAWAFATLFVAGFTTAVRKT
jgi:hypothetical protein